MILFLDHKLFGNGYGLKSPYFDSAFYWLNGELYTFAYGFGAQLQSIQWTHPVPGERRTLAGREFVVFSSRREWLRVVVYWSMVNMPKDLEHMCITIKKLKSDLDAL